MTGRNAIFITIIIIVIIGIIMFAALPDTPPAAGAATPVGVRAAIHCDETAALTKETVGNRNCLEKLSTVIKQQP